MILFTAVIVVTQEKTYTRLFQKIIYLSQGFIQSFRYLNPISTRVGGVRFCPPLARTHLNFLCHYVTTVYLNRVNIFIIPNLEETPKHVVPGEVNTTIPGLGTDGSANNTNSKKVIVNGNATATTAAQVANDTNSERIKYVYVREHEHMHHGHSHAHSHIHSAPDSISSVAYMVRKFLEKNR